jgi:hypothetical protein
MAGYSTYFPPPLCPGTEQALWNIVNIYLTVTLDILIAKEF